ncbi:hypothetical protein H2203_009128 [Taxawa tesnikishii (nom. ined.)]|nr:hypothetical protein H2203_009128 [Dothideales sp. JES 119]
MPGAANGTNGIHAADAPRPLKVVIIGGGIGGLTAAIALRQAGHRVVVLEQWDGANETGAAIHLAPNANGILRRLGLYAETFGANAMNRLTEYTTDGSEIRSLDLVESNKQWQHPWQLVHRIHLHSQLQKTATSPSGKGEPVDMRYSAKVIDTDPETASAILESGERIEGDVLIGADGVFSETRKKVKGGHIRPFSSGKSAFRFLVDKKEVLNDPQTKKYAEREGELVMFLGPDSKIVVYPCQNNELLNFVCIHPAEATAAPADDWNAGGSKKLSSTFVLPLGTEPHEVAERLKVYETCRYERAHRIQEYTRIAGRCLNDEGTIDMVQYTNYNFGHDEFDSATKVFDEWRWAKDPEIYWRMPVSFGPAPGPRQALYTNRPQPARHSTFTTASIKFKTSRTFLQNLFPSKSFSFKSPGTVAYASFSQTTLGKMEWLGGSGYRHFGLYLHDPIVSGRDELGMPKVFCEIDIRRREDSYRVRTHWQGSMFGMFNLDELEQADPATEAGTIGGEADYGILTYKYSPAVGERGKADAAYAVVVPHAEESKVVPSKVQAVWKSKKPNFRFDSLTQQDLPTLHHIVSKLAQIPIYECVSGKVVEGYGVPDVSAARRVE